MVILHFEILYDGTYKENPYIFIQYDQKWLTEPMKQKHLGNTAAGPRSAFTQLYYHSGFLATLALAQLFLSWMQFPL